MHTQVIPEFICDNCSTVLRLVSVTLVSATLQHGLVRNVYLVYSVLSRVSEDVGPGPFLATYCSRFNLFLLPIALVSVWYAFCQSVLATYCSRFSLVCFLSICSCYLLLSFQFGMLFVYCRCWCSRKVLSRSISSSTFFSNPNLETGAGVWTTSVSTDL